MPAQAVDVFGQLRESEDACRAELAIEPIAEPGPTPVARLRALRDELLQPGQRLELFIHQPDTPIEFVACPREG